MQFGNEDMSITLFEQQPMRRTMHDGRWFYSVIDVVAVLTDTKHPRRYWSDLKHNSTDIDFALLQSHCLVVKMKAQDGKYYETDAFTIDDIIQIIRRIPVLRQQSQEGAFSNPNTMGIYAIINTITGEQYVGSSTDIMNRYKMHRSDLRRGKHHSARLQSAWDQNGEEAFSFIVLEEVTDMSDLVSREQSYLVSGNYVYNTATVANNAATMELADEDKRRRLIKFLEQEEHLSFEAAFFLHLQFAIEQGIVIPGSKYHLLLDAARANISTWEDFQAYVIYE